MRVLFLLCFIMFAGTVFAVEIEAEGEAVIVNDDTSSAKTMALSRAKWAAIETVSPAKIKIDTIINNSELADEAVKTELSATIKSFTIINEKVDDNKYIVKIKANVIPEKAESLIDGLSSDTSICVMIAGELPGDNTLYFDQALSAAVIEQLNEKGFTIKMVDYSNIKNTDYNKVFANPAYSNIKNIVKNADCRNILLGKLSITDMGNNVGYGRVSFKLISGDLNYKLISAQNNNIKILKSGFFSGRSQGATLNAAALNIYKSMANNTAVKLVSQVSETVLGNNYKSIRIVLSGGYSAIDDINKLKDDLKNIPFVLQVKEQDDKSVIVDYPDKSYYLGVFLERDNKYKVIKLSDNELIIRK